MKRKEIFVLRRGGDSKICCLKNGIIVELHRLNLPADGKYTISKNGWIACIIKAGRRISTVKLNLKDDLNVFPPIILPERFQALSIGIYKDILLVGGLFSEKELLGMIRLRTKKRKWIPLYVPEGIRMNGKAIDEILFVGDYLIAVDNMILPKWLLVYSLSNPSYPLLESLQEIPIHGTNENIVCGTVGNEWIALMSRTVGRAGVGFHISILDKGFFCEKYSISFKIPLSDLAKRSNGSNRNKIDFLGDILFITLKEKGLGFINFLKMEKDRSIERYYTKDMEGFSVENVIPHKTSNQIIIEMNKNGKYISKVIALGEIVNSE